MLQKWKAERCAISNIYRFMLMLSNTNLGISGEMDVQKCTKLLINTNLVVSNQS